MKPFPTRLYSNFPFDDYKDLPLTVLEHFEWSQENEGGRLHQPQIILFPRDMLDSVD
jgi:hypothetical protein